MKASLNEALDDVLHDLFCIRAVRIFCSDQKCSAFQMSEKKHELPL